MEQYFLGMVPNSLRCSTRQNSVAFSFFSFFNDILDKQSKTSRGCFLKSVCYNSIMFADDLGLLTISFRYIQFWDEMCQTELTIIGMEFNAKKSSCIRLGIRHNLDVHLIILNAEPLPWKKNCHLGLVITTRRKFSVNFQNSRKNSSELLTESLVRCA